MKKTPTTQKKGRREFLRTSAVVGAGAGIASALPGTAMASEPAAEKTQKNKNYRVTPHIADYYKTLS